MSNFLNMLFEIPIWYKEIATFVWICLSIYSYYYYFKDIFAKKVKPHAFTRLVWWILTAIWFFAQVVGDAGIWAWIMGSSALICFVIFFLALYYGEKKFDKTDYIFLSISLIAIWVWYITETPLRSVLIITIADIVAFFPTIRKWRAKPDSDSISLFVISWVKMFLGVIALDNFTIITTLYPSSLVLMNMWFGLMLWYRRYTIKTTI